MTRNLGPLRKVVSVGTGKNPMLVLECGHGRRHSRGVTVPKRVHCMSCEVGEVWHTESTFLADGPTEPGQPRDLIKELRDL